MMDNFESVAPKTSWLDTPLHTILPKFKVEHLLMVLIIIAAVVSRFAMLGLRVMSHDEINHVVPSHTLYQGDGYAHDPVTHGPMQFHLVAASYFLLGDTDFASRVPAALFSIATIIFVMTAFRKYLGKTGALLSGLFFLISPYMLFYGRYTRNEAFVSLFGVIMLYAVLRYLEKGKIASLYLFTIVLSLHFCTKETSFIYTAQLLIFLAILFIRDIIQQKWTGASNRDWFIILTMSMLFFIMVALGAAVLNKGNGTAQASTEAVVSNPIYHIVLLISLSLAIVALVSAIVVVLVNLSWNVVKNIRSFDLLLLTMTMVLPQLIAFPIKLAGFDPLDYTEPGLIRTGLFLLGAVIISFVLGFLWKPKIWLANMAIFYGIFTVFYTTFFTNGQGFFTGIVGSLGYWLSQQEVNRGSQPWFYFAFLQVPMYEYLPAIGTIIAAVIGFRKKIFSTVPGFAPAFQPVIESIDPDEDFNPEDAIEGTSEENTRKIPVLALLLFWSMLSLVAYSIAGEKMPWLTVHITLAMLLASGFSIGYLLDKSPFKQILSNKGLLALVLLPVFLVSMGSVIGSLLGPDHPFAGKELAQLQTTSTFLFSVILALGTGWGLYRMLADWRGREIVRLLSLALLTILAILTARSAYQASYINYDTGKEFLVYAHAARGPKDVLAEVEEISARAAGGNDIKVAYIGDALYPYWWYFRDYPNKTWLKDELTRDLLNYPVVISDDDQHSKVVAILKDGYIETAHKRLVWPMQDYFSLTLKSFWEDFKNPEMRAAIFDIWLNKDYTSYARVKNNSNLTLETWEPSQNIYLFVRKDIIAEIWKYGTIPATVETTVTDPYDGKYITLKPDLYFGMDGATDGSFANPRDLAIAPDGTIYVADSRNHRIQKFASSGEFIKSWGVFANLDAGEAPGGTFNEPWGIAVAPDGSVYVADTWNHRIQKFSSDGKFITMWGQPGPSESPTLFWGPRGIAVDKKGLVYVTDTGNNRVVVFDADGDYVNQFGVNGINSGEFDEPVGIAIDDKGLIYIADTWNQRIQVFEPLAPDTYSFLREWSVSAWVGQSINNKPFIDVDQQGNVFISDPDAFRVLEFDNMGNFIRGWGEPGSTVDSMSSPCGIAVDSEGKVWVSDAENNFVLRFTLPAQIVSDGGVVAPIKPLPGLTYDASGVLLNGLGMPIYMLNEDKTEWVPIIPEGIISLLPSGTIPEISDLGFWVLKDTEGLTVFQWDADVMVWVSVQ